MTQRSRHYAMNYPWVWGPENRELDKSATLAMKLRGADPQQLDELLDTWLADFSFDAASGCHYQGGFSVDIQARGPGTMDALFSSGGQDVAESLGWAVDDFHDQVLKLLDTADVAWTELPLEP